MRIFIFMVDKFNSMPFNYCDYRCDRCDETNNCRVYKENKERILQHYLRGEDPDDPQVFINDLKHIFDKTKDMLEKTAQEQGINIDERSEEDNEEIEPRSYLIYNYAYEYYIQAEKLIRKVEKTRISEEINEDFDDFVWYHTLLVAKTSRLVSGFDDNFFDEEVREIEQGTLLVINKAITLSKKALEHMLNELPDDFQQITGLLELLKRFEKQLKIDMRAKAS